jgi:hypothetical protein
MEAQRISGLHQKRARLLDQHVLSLVLTVVDAAHVRFYVHWRQTAVVMSTEMLAQSVASAPFELWFQMMMLEVKRTPCL